MVQAFPNTNSVVVTPDHQARGEGAWLGWLRPMLGILVEERRPDWAVAGTSELRRAQRDFLSTPGANLLTWVPQAELPSLPAARQSELAGGTLLEVGDGRLADATVEGVVGSRQGIGRYRHPSAPPRLRLRTRCRSGPPSRTVVILSAAAVRERPRAPGRDKVRA